MLSFDIPQLVAPYLGVFLFRATPFLLWALATGRLRATHKVASAISYGVLAAVLSVGDGELGPALVHTPLAIAYFALAAGLTHGMQVALAEARIGKPALFALLTTLFVVLPALAVPDPLIIPVITVGWDMLLSAYSYCHDVTNLRRRPSLRACLFFIIVHPVLVYSQAGAPERAPGFQRRGLLRCALGVGTLVTQHLAIQAIKASKLDDALLNNLGNLGGFPLVLAMQALIIYLAHSSLASIQIGLMRLAGYEPPERYHFPFLATSPMDFWRRWNSYVGMWAQRYLFMPVVFELSRRRTSDGRMNPALAKGMSIIVTFLGIGVLHDLIFNLIHLIQSGHMRASLNGTLFFSFHALIFIAWFGAASPISHAVGKALGKRHVNLAGNIGGWLAFSQVSAAMAWFHHAALNQGSGAAIGRIVASVAGVLS